MQRRPKYFSLIVLLVLVIVFLVVKDGRSSSFQASTINPNNQPTTVTIDQKTFVAEVATSPQAQLTGLSNRRSLAEGSGMLFLFSPPQQVGFWMRDMLFPLDIIFIDPSLKIIQIERDLPPPAANTPAANLTIYTPPQPVSDVLEINANQAKNFNIGDSVVITHSSSL